MLPGPPCSPLLRGCDQSSFMSVLLSFVLFMVTFESTPEQRADERVCWFTWGGQNPADPNTPRCSEPVILKWGASVLGGGGS